MKPIPTADAGNQPYLALANPNAPFLYTSPLGQLTPVPAAPRVMTSTQPVRPARADVLVELDLTVASRAGPRRSAPARGAWT